MPDVIELGRHRLLCGDAASDTDMHRLMAGEKAVLLHADPPYGMGKAIANDNLYREKLDRFQMAWWRAARHHLTDNASAYIWGKAEDLWRLWYRGGLQESERLTLRNDITWYKGATWGANPHGNGMNSEQGRMYAAMSEHCLFLVLGEQGFNTNADNYWEGWEPIRAYLDGERQAMGWDIPTVKALVGHSDLSRDHWFSRSQWLMPTRLVYDALQRAANGDAFKRDYDSFSRSYDSLKQEYDSLKQEWYATRAYFDNTHEAMTDVWRYPSVADAERWGHPTPKPVAMMERICRTSAPEGGLILDPMAGTGSMLIAAENTGRRCFAMEIDATHCQAIVTRYERSKMQPRLFEMEHTAPSQSSLFPSEAAS